MPEEQNNQIAGSAADNSAGKEVGLATQAPEPQKSSKKFNMKSKKVLTGFLVFAMLIAGVTAWQLSKKSNDNSATQSQASYVTSTFPVVCVDLGLDSLQCENAETKELVKYRLPKSLGDINSMLPSPDGSKILISSWKDADIEYIAVLDGSLKVIAEIPVKFNKETSSPDVYFYDMDWLDNNSLVYTKYNETASKQEKSNIYTFDVLSGKETLLMSVPASPEHSIEKYMPAGDGRYIYVYQGKEDKPNDAIIRSLALLDTKKKEVVDIKNDAINADEHELIYSPNSALFYTNDNHHDDSGAITSTDIRIFKINNLETDPSLTEAHQVTGLQFSNLVLTTKGMLAHEGNEVWPRGPLKLFMDSQSSTQLNLAVGGSGSIRVALPDFPSYQRATSSHPEVSDFFRPPSGVPESITAFLSKQVTESKDCKENEYLTFELDKYDGDEQFSTSEYGCGNDNLAFYIMKNGTFTKVGGTQEGISCTERDRLGISEKIVGCLKPGEGL